jgi:hypothetical protein
VSFIIVLGIIAAVLFGAAFVTKRKFGMLALGLTAGVMLSGLWAAKLTPIVAQAGFVLVKPPLEAVVATALTLLPAILLLFTGKKQKSLPLRAIGAGAFAVLAITFLLEPIGAALVIDTTGQPVYDFLVKYHDAIITAGLALAVLDLLFAKSPKAQNHDAKH